MSCANLPLLKQVVYTYFADEIIEHYFQVNLISILLNKILQLGICYRKPQFFQILVDVLLGPEVNILFIHIHLAKLALVDVDNLLVLTVHFYQQLDHGLVCHNLNFVLKSVDVGPIFDWQGK